MSDFDDLNRDLTSAAELLPKKAAQAIEQTARRTRDRWRRIASRNPLGRQYTATIDYTLRNPSGFGVTDLQAEVGPNLTRYGGKTGRGGLAPSAGIFDDPINQGGIHTTPDRSRVAAEQFAEDELTKGLTIALDQSLKENGL